MIELNSDLKDYICEGRLGLMIHHPLTIQIFYNEQMNEMINQIYESKKEAVEEALKNKDIHRFIYLHERPYRLEALYKIIDQVPKDKYWDIITNVYIDTENYYQNKGMWNALFSANIKVPEKFNIKEDMLTIYRGFRERGAQKGISWTLSKEKAEWFAKRFEPEKAKIAEMKIDKKDVVCFIKQRGEEEIIIHPKLLKNLKCEITELNKIKKHGIKL